MSNDPFHQTVFVELQLDKTYSSGELNRTLKEQGATLHYDVYSFDRTDDFPVWQSEAYIDLSLFLGGEPSDAQDGADKIVIEYPLATISSEYITKFIDKTFTLAETFKSKVYLDGKTVCREELLKYCDSLVTDLMEEWGEEPGNESLSIMIERSYQ